MSEPTGDLHISTRPPRCLGPAGGATALLVHGAMDRSTSFTRLAQRLEDWTILTYDRRGYARSQGRPASSRFSDQVDDLIEVLQRHEVHPPNKLVAFGHSLGGDVVLGAAARRPDGLAAAVVYEAPTPWEPWWPSTTPPADWRTTEPSQLAENFMRRVLGDHIWERLPASTRDQRRREGSTMVAEVGSLSAAPPFVGTDITIPVIVARGALAAQRHLRAANALVAAIPGSQLVVVDGADHGAHLSHPAPIAELLRRALALAILGPSSGSRPHGGFDQ